MRSVGEISGVVPKSIGISSCSSGSGVSTVAANLAAAAAHVSDDPVLLFDLSCGRRGRTLQHEAAVSLGAYGNLEHDLHPCECVKASYVPNLSLLAAHSDDEPQWLGKDAGRISDVLQALEKEFSLIVVDLPPVESSVCFVTAGLLSGVLLVMEAERTSSHTASRAKQRLIDARASVLGVILNKNPQHLPNWLASRM
jgi:Mrp family chromosome partitioning ATPase